jgi:SAM-dependent methyltransferase
MVLSELNREGESTDAKFGGTVFYQMLADYYDLIFPPEQSKTDFLHREFAAVGARRVLDLACGTGTYTIELARLGYEAWGTDLEPALLELAQSKAAHARVAATFAAGDMRQPEALGLMFDSLLCIGNSLPHLQEKNDLESALAAMRRVLRSPGRAVLQIVNFDRILALGDTELPLIERGGLRFTRTYRPRGEGRLLFDSVLEVAGKGEGAARFENRVILRPLRRADLERFLLAAGFAAVRVYGDFKYGEYRAADSQATVAVAEC